MYNSADMKFSRPSLNGIIVVLLLTLPLAGCSWKGWVWNWRKGGNELDVWVASEMVQLTDSSKKFHNARLFSKTEKTVTLLGVMNETACFQIVVEAGDEDINNLEISWDDLKNGENVIPRENISVFRMLGVEVSLGRAWHYRLSANPGGREVIYDPLVPIDDKSAGQPYDADGSSRLVFWVDLSIDRDIKPGRYEGKITISSSNRPGTDMNLQLDVLDFSLPDTPAILAVGGFDHAQLFSTFFTNQAGVKAPTRLDRKDPTVIDTLVRMRKLMILARAHRLDLFDTQLKPLLKRTPKGEVKLNWSDYDAIITPYLDGSAFPDQRGVHFWPVPFSQSWPDPKYYGGLAGESYMSTAAEVLKGCDEHFRSLGYLQPAVLWPWRGDLSDDAYKTHMLLADIADKSGVKLPVLCQLPPSPDELTGLSLPAGFSSTVDLIAPAGQWFDPKLSDSMNHDPKALLGNWLSPGKRPYAPSMSIDAGAADMRALAWFGISRKCSGLLIEDVLNWSGDMIESGPSADTGLFYPGALA
ncbi:MAG TPA: hypothetical protein ENL03_03445, partial [Phycisphaerae bacterium]|nr:hypothetical protein [Phycisphaerae bacterium]